MPATPGISVSGTLDSGDAPVWDGTKYVATDVATASELASHEGDTTAVHGIADTSALVTTATTLVGDVGGTVGATAIGAGKVTPTMLSVPARPFVYLAGSYYAPPGVTGAAATAANNETRFARIWLPKGRTVDRLGLNVTVAGSASSTIRLGLYAASVTTGLPDGSPLIDGGTIDGTSNTFQEKTVSYAIPEGNWFWLSTTCQGASAGTPTVTTLSSTSVPEEGIPMFSTTLSTVGLRVAAFAAGALPTATGATFALGTAPRPIVRLT